MNMTTRPLRARTALPRALATALQWRLLGRKKTRVQVRFGEALDFSVFRGREETHELLTEMTAFIIAAITAELRNLR